MNNVKNIFKTLLKVVISCGFFYILFSFIEQNELKQLFLKIDWFYLILSFLVTGVMLLASCLKWKVILDMKENKLTFFYLLRVYFIGYFFSNLLPSTVGGDVVRSYYVGEKIGNHAHSAVAIFIERFSGIMFLFLLAMVAPLLHIELYRSPYVYLPAITGFSLLCIIFWIWKAEAPLKYAATIRHVLFTIGHDMAKIPGLLWLEKLVKWGENFWSKIDEKVKKVHYELQGAVKVIMTNRKKLMDIFLLTVLFYLLTWVNVYFGYLTFGVKPDFLVICALTPTIMFAAHLPVTLLGNIGYFESVFVFFFLLVGIPAEQTLAMGLLLRIKTLSMGTIGFFIYLFNRDHYKRPWSSAA